jgi:predicted transcriptional regulator|tara:strand:+ start:369 stop:530 length:162 start_codon:yes stop_codon:yes gene_type:complete
MARDNIFFAERRIFKLWGSGEITLSQLKQLMSDRGWSEKEINFLLNTLTWVLF